MVDVLLLCILKQKKTRSHPKLRAKPVSYQTSIARKRCPAHHPHYHTSQQKQTHTFLYPRKNRSTSRTTHSKLLRANCAKVVSFSRILCRGRQVNCVQRMSGGAHRAGISSHIFYMNIINSIARRGC
jgi:hypothetical protein